LDAGGALGRPVVAGKDVKLLLLARLPLEHGLLGVIQHSLSFLVKVGLLSRICVFEVVGEVPFAYLYLAFRGQFDGYGRKQRLLEAVSPQYVGCLNT